MHTYIHARKHFVNKFTFELKRIQKKNKIQTHYHTNTHARTLTNTHTTHGRTHTHTHTYIYTYTHHQNPTLGRSANFDSSPDFSIGKGLQKKSIQRSYNYCHVTPSFLFPSAFGQSTYCVETSATKKSAKFLE